MTTIATDGKTMAGDGVSSMSGTIVATGAVKVRRLKDGSLFGSCGSAQAAAKLADWMDAGSEGDWPVREDDFGAIILRPDGSLFTCANTDGLAPADAPVAMGTGMDFAIGAMDAGASPEEAVRIAIGRDPRSGGTITVEALA